MKIPPTRKPPTRDLYPISLNCPLCGQKLTYVQTEGDVSVYQCANDGVVLFPPIGPIRVVVH